MFVYIDQWTMICVRVKIQFRSPPPPGYGPVTGQELVYVFKFIIVLDSPRRLRHYVQKFVICLSPRTYSVFISKLDTTGCTVGLLAVHGLCLLPVVVEVSQGSGW